MTMRVNRCSGIGVLVLLMVLAPIGISVVDEAGIAVAGLSRIATVHAGTTIHVPADYPTIQEGINAASDGDEIIVAPGTYNEAIDFLGKAIHLRSSDGPEATVLDGSDLESSIITISGVGPSAAIVEGFEFRNGTGTLLEGQFVGGAILVDESVATLFDSRFENNEASRGGAIYVDNASNVLVHGSNFTSNRAIFAPNPRQGGAIFIRGSTVDISECAFLLNESLSGGAILSGSETSLAIQDSTFISNTALSGGALSLGLGVSIIQRSHFEHNKGGGGAIRTGGGEVVVEDCYFLENEFINQPGSRHGGAISAERSSEILARNCVFESNHANRGGAVYVFGGGFHAVNCLFRANSGSSVGGIAVWSISGGSGVSVVNSTFVENSSSFGNGSAIYINSGLGIEMHNSIVWGNTSPQISAWIPAFDPTVSFSIIQDGYPGTGNLDHDPLFVSQIDGNFRLSPDSPAIDSGSNMLVPADVTTDLDGNPRIVDGNDDGNQIVDMGAYEYQPPILAHLDIRPGSCPNPLNPNSQGVLPVALLGTDEFDVSAVNLETLTLSRADGIGGSATPNFGPPGPAPKIEDVGTPFDGDDCDCHDLGGDGIPDLSLKFWMGPLVEALELDAEYSDTYIELSLTGELNDGTSFIANDCVRIVGQPHNPGGSPSFIPETGIPSLDRFLDEWHRSTFHQN